MTDAYLEHISVLQARWEAALSGSRLDAVIVAAGSSETYFLDDQAPPYRPNPHFAQWLPGLNAEGSLLVIQPGKRPELFFYQPDDYWHVPPAPPEVPDVFSVSVFGDEAGLQAAAARSVERINHVAWVGPPAGGTNLPAADVNPGQLIDHMHYQRAVKTEFELNLMREATRKAVRGHLAAREAFAAGASEFDIHQAYLSASRQTEAELPYPNIVALNHHAGVLHYQHYDRDVPGSRVSFLIDAGARHRGYAADVTRTYAAADAGDFAALIHALDAAQQELVADIRAAGTYLDLHERMHRQIAQILTDAGLVADDPDAVFELGITDHFFPHGLGHLLGIQTHDVGGHLTSPAGGQRLPPERYPALRLTREIDIDQVFTIEPGIYFIPSLLDALKAGPQRNRVNWPAVERLAPAGGIRIEDNVRVLADGVENFTRDAFSELERT